MRRYLFVFVPFVFLVASATAAVISGERAAAVPPAPAGLPAGGDCNDIDPSVHPGLTEIVGNRLDDDCDGLADEDVDDNPSADTGDADFDSFSPASGDCDDTDPAVHAGQAEMPGNLFDDDCDGMADENIDGSPSGDGLDHDGDGVPITTDRIFASGFDEAA